MKDAPSFKKKIFNWAIKVGKDYVALSHSQYPIPFFLKVKHNSLSYKSDKYQKIPFYSDVPSVNIANFFVFPHYYPEYVPE